jgi:hypothetical protein
MEDRNSKKEKQKEKKLKKRLAKKRSLTYEKLGKVVNLHLVLGVAAIGYQANLLVDGKYNLQMQNLDIIGGLAWFSFLASLGLLVVSVGLGLICTYNRLIDLRYAALLLEKRIDKASKEDICDFKTKTKNYGEKVWPFFARHLVTFGIGLFFIVVFYFWRYIG